jgi:hypothetical protein
MSERFRTVLWRAIHLFLVCLISTGTGIAYADIPDTNSATTLRAKYLALRDTLSHNQFQLPLNLDSSQTSTDLKGDIYALMDYPFATVSTALNGANHWCDILILHLNVKYCRESADKPGSNLTVYIGRKTEQSLNIASRMEFEYRVGSNSSDYLQIFLDADKGPFGTKLSLHAGSNPSKRRRNIYPPIIFVCLWLYGKACNAGLPEYVGKRQGRIHRY